MFLGGYKRAPAKGSIPMKAQISVLLLEDNLLDAELLQEILKEEGFNLNMRRVDTERDFLEALKNWTPDIIISDFSLPSYVGTAALAASVAQRPDIPFIFFSGTIGEESAIEALKQGASDYVLKQRPKRLVSAFRRALAERKQRKKQQEAEEKIVAQAQLLNLASDAIIVFDLKDRVLFWNTGAEQLYGFTAKETDEKSVTMLLYGESEISFAEAKRQTLEHRQWKGELNQISRNGNDLVVTSRWTLLCNSEGQPVKILMINTDITEKKKFETQFLRAQRMESLGTLAGGIAHDLNNILAPIMMASQLLRRTETDPKALARIEMIHKSAQRGAEIVKQLLTFVRGNEGRITNVKVPDLLHDISKLTRETFPKNIAIHMNADPGVGEIKGDPTQLHQVLMNLCINARDAMPDGGELTVTASNMPEAPDQPPRILIEVKDTGTGISPVVKEKIFDPFFTTKEAGKGTGLGLSTVLGIIKGHGGEMEVESAVGKGSTFKIYLCRSLEQHLDISEIPGANIPKGKGELILVVDDEPEIRMVIAQTLVEHGYETITADDGNSAILRFSEQKGAVRLVLSDIMMPGLDGGSLVKVLLTLDPKVKIVVSSGLQEPGNMSEASGFLKKPFTSEDLLRTIHSCLSKK
jgi:PAS domain S-box-containing protein